MKGIKFLYLPNENHIGDQIGPRKAFENMLDEGLLSDYETFSYLIEDKLSETHEATLMRLLQVAVNYNPDVIFWQHLNDNFPVDRAFLRKLKGISSKPKLVLYEEDPYDRLIKRIPKSMKAILAESDLVFLGGIGYLAELAHDYGASKVMYAPHSYDNIRFGGNWTPSYQRSYDVTMIANLTCIKRIPWLHMPGGKSRKKLADSMHEEFGERFALFGTGQGWNGKPYCNGPIPFDQQESVIRDSWMSVNWGQFDKIGYYSSDRLSISLAAGVPHITNYQPGYEHIYENVPGLYVIRSVDEAVNIARYLISQPKKRLIEIGKSGAVYAAQNLEANEVYSDIVQVIGEQLFGWET